MISAEMIDIVGPALFAGLMIAATHAPLGIEVLKRGIIFIDLAVAQIAGLGLIVSNLFFHDVPMWIMQFAALICAVSAGLFFRKIEEVMPEQQEAIIGVSFVLAASVAVLLLVDHPHGWEEIRHLLSGQMLFVTWKDALFHAPIYAIILMLWFFKPACRNGAGFYLLFASAITSSVQLAGVYVVFASLILPALAAIRAARPHVVAWSCAVLSVMIGMVAAIVTDMPAGPILVISYVNIAIFMAWLRFMCRRIS